MGIFIARAASKIFVKEETVRNENDAVKNITLAHSSGLDGNDG